MNMSVRLLRKYFSWKARGCVPAWATPYDVVFIRKFPHMHKWSAWLSIFGTNVWELLDNIASAAEV